MDDQQQQLLDQFVSLTGDEQRAKFFLNSSDWDLDTAVQLFYDWIEGREGESQGSSDLAPNLTEPTPEIQEDMSNNPSGTSRNDNNNNRRNNQSNIATLSSLHSDNEPDRQAFYAGGSETSGQQILGSPSARKSDSNQIITDLFRQAREHAEDVSDDNEQPSTSKPVFTGAGFTLGSSNDDSVKIMSHTANTARSDYMDSDQDVERILKMWQNGFSIDDGPLRSYDDPSNLEFMNCIRRGQIPPELRNGNAQVRLAMQDHRTEDYIPPKVVKNPFSGEGHRLGTPVSEVISNLTAFSNDNTSAEQKQSDAESFLALNESEPNTRVQIRLADGSRINLDKLISDLRQYICIARPEFSALAFNLMTTFPNKVIENENLTIKDSGLANSCVVQRLV